MLCPTPQGVPGPTFISLIIWNKYKIDANIECLKNNTFLIPMEMGRFPNEWLLLSLERLALHAPRWVRQPKATIWYPTHN